MSNIIEETPVEETVFTLPQNEGAAEASVGEAVIAAPAKKPKKLKEGKGRLSPLTIVMLVVLCLYCLFMFILVGWAFLRSFQCYSDARNHPFIPKIFTWTIRDERAIYWSKGVNKNLLWMSNYAYIIEKFSVSVPKAGGGNRTVDFGEMVLNTILYAGGGAFVNALVQCLTAYLCARYAFKLSGVIYTAVIFAMVLPVVGSLPSEIEMARNLGIYNKIWGTWIMKANFLGMYFLVFHEMFKAMPASYSEAATIDGANDWQILWKIGLPLAKNTFFTILLLNFVSLWNDYQISMVYIPDHPVLAQRLHTLHSDSDGLVTQDVVKMAGCFILLIPVLTLFLCFHKRLMGNLTIGGVKG